MQRQLRLAEYSGNEQKRNCISPLITACSTFVGTENYRVSNKFAPDRAFRPRSGQKSRASARNMARLQAPLFSPFFSGKTDGTKLQTSEAFAIWRGRATERTRPAACGGARDVEFVRTKVCEATAAVSPHSTAVPVNSDKRADLRTAPLRRRKFWRSRKESRRIAPAAPFPIYSFSRTISANARQVGFPPASMAACTAASSRSALSTSPICRRSMASALRMLAGLA